VRALEPNQQAAGRGSGAPTVSNTVRAVTYRRVSTRVQLGGTSPETQLARAEKLISNNRWEHVADFYDPGVSGAETSRRELNRLF
jgi:DNA invertase Pin-like site-specific DNA recombinase